MELIELMKSNYSNTFFSVLVDCGGILLSCRLLSGLLSFCVFSCHAEKILLMHSCFQHWSPGMECETCQQMSVETVVEEIAHIAN